MNTIVEDYRGKFTDMVIPHRVSFHTERVSTTADRRPIYAGVKSSNAEFPHVLIDPVPTYKFCQIWEPDSCSNFENRSMQPKIIFCSNVFHFLLYLIH